ncbi:8835_t:CDS:2 [Funneliformis geosporum]|uniref:8835_t:CDS:1 n=1 Tax=Funneliformis geosporum TaxID=1117311 RepID=A0A9W4T155_9GLOM|nr:8835_t:CDS:2 [Funneliformis geosporum]
MATGKYNFGMIMWEFITGQKAFWDKVHNTALEVQIITNNP